MPFTGHPNRMQQFFTSKSTKIQDIRQMFVYQHYFDSEQSLLLYPESSKQSDGDALEAYDFQRYEAPDPKGESKHSLAAGELALFEGEKLILPEDLGRRLLKKTLPQATIKDNEISSQDAPLV